MKDSFLALTISRNTLKVFKAGAELTELEEVYRKELGTSDFQTFLNCAVIETSVSVGEAGVSFDLVCFHNADDQVIYRRVRPLPLQLIYSITRRYREHSETLNFQVLRRRLVKAEAAGLVDSQADVKAQLFELLLNYGHVSLIEALFKTPEEIQLVKAEVNRRVVDLEKFDLETVGTKQSAVECRQKEQIALALAGLSKSFHLDHGFDLKKLALFYRALQWLVHFEVAKCFSNSTWNWHQRTEQSADLQAKFQGQMAQWKLDLPSHKLLFYSLAEVEERPSLRTLRNVCLKSTEAFLHAMVYLLHDVPSSALAKDARQLNLPLSFKCAFNVSDVAFCSVSGFWQLDKQYEVPLDILPVSQLDLQPDIPLSPSEDLRDQSSRGSVSLESSLQLSPSPRKRDPMSSDAALHPTVPKEVVSRGALL
jgi:hypothetical protein